MDYVTPTGWWVQTVELVLQRGEYRTTVNTDVGGNCAGFDVLDAAVSNIWDRLTEDYDEDYAMPHVHLVRDSDEDDALVDRSIGRDGLRALVVSARIVAVRGTPAPA